MTISLLLWWRYRYMYVCACKQVWVIYLGRLCLGINLYYLIQNNFKICDLYLSTCMYIRDMKAGGKTVSSPRKCLKPARVIIRHQMPSTQQTGYKCYKWLERNPGDVIFTPSLRYDLWRCMSQDLYRIQQIRTSLYWMVIN